MRVLAIDPGPTESAYVIIDEACLPLRFGKVLNADLRDMIPGLLAGGELGATTAAIEMIASYGMSVGADVFDTCVWVGRFSERCRSYWHASGYPRLVYRRDIKLHHCGTSKAKDPNITQALIDRFAKGEPNRGKGTKSAPGWFHGFHSDVWQAYALAVYVADREQGGVW